MLLPRNKNISLDALIVCVVLSSLLEKAFTFLESVAYHSKCDDDFFKIRLNLATVWACSGAYSKSAFTRSRFENQRKEGVKGNLSRQYQCTSISGFINGALLATRITGSGQRLLLTAHGTLALCFCVQEGAPGAHPLVWTGLRKCHLG